MDLKTIYLKPFIYYILAGVLSTVILHIPILGAIWGLFTVFPIFDVFPYLEEPEHTEVGFLWLIIKSQKAWLIFSIYYAVLWFIVFTFIKIVKKQK